MQAGGSKVVDVVGPRTVRLLTQPPHQFNFDSVVGEAFTQRELFEGEPTGPRGAQSCDAAWKHRTSVSGGDIPECIEN